MLSSHALRQESTHTPSGAQTPSPAARFTPQLEQVPALPEFETHICKRGRKVPLSPNTVTTLI